MIEVSYGSMNEEVVRILDRLRRMSLAHRAHLKPGLDSVVLHDGNDFLDKPEMIEDFLDQLEKELFNWYYCDC